MAGEPDKEVIALARQQDLVEKRTFVQFGGTVIIPE